MIKKTLWFVILLLSTSSAVMAESDLGAILAGDHLVRKASIVRAGGVASVTFMWRLNDGSYSVNSVPLEKVRVRYEAGAVNPSIRFRWGASNGMGEGLQKKIEQHVIYVLLTCREEQWPPDAIVPVGTNTVSMIFTVEKP